MNSRVGLALLTVLAVVLPVIGAEKLTVDSAKQRVQQLESRFKEIKEKVDGLKEEFETLKTKVEQRIADLKALAKNREQLSQTAKDRLALLETGEEAKQLDGLREAEKLGDEGVILMAYAAKQSTHEKVRRRAIEAAVGTGEAAYPAIAFAYDSLPNPDRMFLTEELGRKKSRTNLLLLIAMAKDANDELREVITDVGATFDDRLLVFAAVGKNGGEAIVDRIVKKATGIEGDDGVLVLYAVAKSGAAKQRIAAIKAAADRKADGILAVAGAFESDDPEVRAEIVRAAKKLGGEVADFVIAEALRAKNETLRKAAEDALK